MSETGKIAAALAEAAKAFPAMTRDREVEVQTRSGGTYRFKYLTLDKIVGELRPILAAKELVLTQGVEADATTKWMVTRLHHSSGETLENRIPLVMGETTPQGMGSALSYARRYGISALLCLAADEDDDANAAEGNQAKAVSTNRQRGRAKIAEAAKPTGQPITLADFVRKQFALLKDLHAMGVVDQEALDPLPNGTFHREKLRVELMPNLPGGKFNKDNPNHWTMWIAALERLRADKLPPADDTPF